MKRPQGIFVTGTDTGVGKTIISAALMHALKANGFDAVYMKPVQTGCLKRTRGLIAPDLEFVLSASGFSPTGKERALMAPYCFRSPCSPHLAARLEKRPVQLSRLISSFNALKRSRRFVIVEGAGGILTPLSWRYSMLDLMQSLALPVILVARPGLGTINHTLLSLRELRLAKLNILGVVFNYSSAANRGIIAASNVETIERLGRVQVLAEFPFLGKLRRNLRARKIRNIIQNIALALIKGQT